MAPTSSSGGRKMMVFFFPSPEERVLSYFGVQSNPKLIFPPRSASHGKIFSTHFPTNFKPTFTGRSRVDCFFLSWTVVFGTHRVFGHFSSAHALYCGKTIFLPKRAPNLNRGKNESSSTTNVGMRIQRWRGLFLSPRGGACISVRMAWSRAAASPEGDILCMAPGVMRKEVQ